MSKEITLQEAALAWAQGKRVEARPAYPKGAVWSKISPVGVISNQTWPASIFNDQSEREFRLAPEPPAKRYRPWTPEEVPVGALTRPKDKGDVLMIIGIRGRGVLLAGDSGDYPLHGLLNLREHSTDNGKTWLPCGVEVSE
jgi:hypothetical protein